MRVSLQFVAEQSPVDRARLEYAFRLFCAIYGHEPIISAGKEVLADVSITYEKDGKSTGVLHLHNAHLVSKATQPAPPPTWFAYRGGRTLLFCPVPFNSEPDWLSEVFEWVSCADEYSIDKLDSVGRTPFSQSYFARHKLNPRTPYASIDMHHLQRALAAVSPRCDIHAQCPIDGARHLVVNTHDVDFLPTSRSDIACRLGKNSLISFLLSKAPLSAARQAYYAMRVAAGGKDPFYRVNALAQEELSRSVTSSYYFLCRREHRRDGNYEIQDPATLKLMHSLQPEMEVGVHGSYTCLEHAGQLAEEFHQLSESGIQALGGRQHWLRFALPKLIEAVELAGTAYDCSLGWPEVTGFRAAASFAFPPYDFREEKPAPFLEIPLVVMDSQLGSVSGKGYEYALEALRASRFYGWGGISLLWHPTAFHGVQLPDRVGDAFWNLIDDGIRMEDTWLSAASFVKSVWKRYVDVGLLPSREFQ